ncbi:MAG: ketoacyl-ACP synthase III [Lachnospiraceae bacterium]|nr:ketoacyl-ACP synthase III [Lachnospiraceae bacterium]
MLRIIGTGSALPEKVADNNWIAQYADTSDAWIQERTGIRQRHIAEDETVAQLAVKAAKAALDNSSISAEDIDLILVATGSSEQLYPCIACEVQAALGAVHAACFDLNAACSGFITAYQTAFGHVKAGLAKNVLVIGAECLSKLVDWTDRGTCILFGDGAGAVILQEQADSEVTQEPVCVMHADGSRGQVLTCNSGRKNGSSPYGEFMQMDGRAIYQFAVRKVPEVIREVLDKAGKQPEDVDYFILHQANKRIIESISARLKQPMEKFPTNIEWNGNISSACIPVLLDEMNRAGKLKPGMKMVLAGFGAGLTWGSIYLEW